MLTEFPRIPSGFKRVRDGSESLIAVLELGTAEESASLGESLLQANKVSIIQRTCWEVVVLLVGHLMQPLKY